MGYVDFSKSERAVEAEERGLLTAGKLAKKLGVDTDTVKEYLRPAEWHHVSSLYTPTDYFDETELLAAASDDADAEPEARELLTEMREHSRRRRGKGPRTFTAEVVEWLEWTGTRNHPHAETQCARNVQVTISASGKTAVIHTPTGDVKKRTNATGFRLVEADR